MYSTILHQIPPLRQVRQDLSTRLDKPFTAPAAGYCFVTVVLLIIVEALVDTELHYKLPIDLVYHLI